jgi:hypothetical protein
MLTKLDRYLIVALGLLKIMSDNISLVCTLNNGMTVFQLKRDAGGLMLRSGPRATLEMTNNVKMVAGK